MESKDTTLEEIRVHCADKNDPERETLDIRKGRDNMKKAERGGICRTNGEAGPEQKQEHSSFITGRRQGLGIKADS